MACFLVLISSHSSKVGIVRCYFFSIPYSVRNVLKNFEIFSQLTRLVRDLGSTSSLGFVQR